MASNISASILIEFKKGLISFFDELIDQFPDESDLIIIRIFLKDQIPILDVMNHFIRLLLPLKPEIKDRNESVFIDNDQLFEALSKDKVNHFKRLWRSGRLEADDKTAIWKWFDSFVFLAAKYQKSVSKN